MADRTLIRTIGSDWALAQSFARDRVSSAAGADIGGDWLPRPYEETPSA
jgi:hypothetical protein